MDVRELESKLQKEGYTHTYVWKDASEVFYPNHTHPGETAHIILDGQMTLTMNGKSEVYYPGDRCDVPAQAVHSALMGPKGCEYLIGEK
ncbi:MAG TPA: cupin domain-containing protein [Candidatus Limnocylindrales bacterium]|nr:cupin domain-containing protein [Candidatus Limnocylindrales bacterium]